MSYQRLKNLDSLEIKGEERLQCTWDKIITAGYFSRRSMKKVCE